MLSFWLRGGGIVTAGGMAVLCAVCPCPPPRPAYAAYRYGYGFGILGPPPPPVKVACCPTPVSGRLFLVLSDFGGCACLDGISAVLDYTGVRDRWESGQVPIPCPQAPNGVGATNFAFGCIYHLDQAGNQIPEGWSLANRGSPTDCAVGALNLDPDSCAPFHWQHVASAGPTFPGLCCEGSVLATVFQ